MATVEEGLQSQIRNIESTYGRSMDEWAALIAASGLERHGQIVAWLKNDHGLPHGAANRVALVALSSNAPSAPEDPIDALYAGRPPSVRAIHDRIWTVVGGLEAVEVAPKKGYLSLRRRTQFGMVKPLVFPAPDRACNATCSLPPKRRNSPRLDLPRMMLCSRIRTATAIARFRRCACRHRRPMSSGRRGRGACCAAAA